MSPKAPRQRLVVYTHRASGETRVYTTCYTEEQARQATIDCVKRHGGRSNVRTRRAG